MLKVKISLSSLLTDQENMDVRRYTPPYTIFFTLNTTLCDHGQLASPDAAAKVAKKYASVTD